MVNGIQQCNDFFKSFSSLIIIRNQPIFVRINIVRFKNQDVLKQRILEYSFLTSFHLSKISVPETSVEFHYSFLCTYQPSTKAIVNIICSRYSHPSWCNHDLSEKEALFVYDNLEPRVRCDNTNHQDTTNVDAISHLSSHTAA